MKKICIAMADDGTYMVGEMPEDMGMAGGDPDYQDDSYMQPAKSLDAALEMARQMLAGGEDPEMAAAQKGYEKNPRMMSGGMGMGKVFGEGM